MSDEIAVIAVAIAQDGLADEVASSIRPCIALTRAEVGCLLYTVHNDIDNPNRFVFIERWSSRAALDAHARSAHFGMMAAGLEDKLTAPFEVKVLKELA
jgi:quinol monooxygenase YgiN